jgi:hypothetical protein
MRIIPRSIIVDGRRLFYRVASWDNGEVSLYAKRWIGVRWDRVITMTESEFKARRNDVHQNSK